MLRILSLSPGSLCRIVASVDNGYLVLSASTWLTAAFWLEIQRHQVTTTTDHFAFQVKCKAMVRSFTNTLCPMGTSHGQFSKILTEDTSKLDHYFKMSCVYFLFSCSAVWNVVLWLTIPWWGPTPVPLTIFRSNSKFHQNLQCSGLKWTGSITTKFCTHHDSMTVVKCAKFRCDRLSIF